MKKMKALVLKIIEIIANIGQGRVLKTEGIKVYIALWDI